MITSDRKDRLARIRANRAAKGGGPTTNGNGQPEVTDDMVFNTILRNPQMVMNAMTQRADLLEKLFDPRRDIDEECGYPKVITEQAFRKMYDRELGRRVVNVYPEESWKELPKIYEDPDPDTETPFEASLARLEKRRHLLHYLQRADELSGVGHYGVILWGLDDGLELKEPVAGHESWEETTGIPEEEPATPKAPAEGDTVEPPPVATEDVETKRNVIYIRVLDESLVTIADWESDVTNPRYGQPTHYNITLADPRNAEAGAIASPPDTTETKVHWTRISHIADNRKTSEVLGTPRQEPVWNRLYDLRKVLGGSGEMYWRGGFPGVSLETQPGLENAELDEEKTRAMMFDYMNGLQRYIALTGMSAKSLAPQISDPTASFEVQVKAICIIIGVPFRVFMGIEEGVVSGDQATKAWDGRLANRQERYISPMLIDPVIQRLIDYGVLAPTATPQGWTIEWPDTTAPSEMDQAEVAAKKTEAFAKYVAGGVDTLIPPREFLVMICGLDEDTADAIIDAAVEHIEGIDDDEQIVPGRVPTPEPLVEAEGGETFGGDAKGGGAGGTPPKKKETNDEDEES